MVMKVELFNHSRDRSDRLNAWLEDLQEKKDIVIKKVICGQNSDGGLGDMYIFYEELEKGHKEIQLVQFVAQEQVKQTKPNRFADVEVVQQ